MFQRKSKAQYSLTRDRRSGRSEMKPDHNKGGEQHYQPAYSHGNLTVNEALHNHLSGNELRRAGAQNLREVKRPAGGTETLPG